jgi:hypothetical protein
MVTYLQKLKETFADPIEGLRLRWIDFSANDNTITINGPVKNYAPRQLSVSNTLVTMLNALPKTSEVIFSTTYCSVLKIFQRMRLRITGNTGNPRQEHKAELVSPLGHYHALPLHKKQSIDLEALRA